MGKYKANFKNKKKFKKAKKKQKIQKKFKVQFKHIVEEDNTECTVQNNSQNQLCQNLEDLNSISSYEYVKKCFRCKRKKYYQCICFNKFKRCLICLDEEHKFKQCPQQKFTQKNYLKKEIKKNNFFRDLLKFQDLQNTDHQKCIECFQTGHLNCSTKNNDKIFNFN